MLYELRLRGGAWEQNSHFIIVINRRARCQNKPRAWENKMRIPKFKFVPATSRIIVRGELVIPACFVREVNDRFDDGSVKVYKLQITSDGIRAGLLDVIYALVKNEGVKFKVDIKEGEGVFLVDMAISAENDADRTVTIGNVVVVGNPPTYEKL